MLSYNPLFKTLIDRKMGKLELCRLAGFSPTTLAKMGKDLPVGLDVIVRICGVLNCGVGDVLLITPKRMGEANV